MTFGHRYGPRHALSLPVSGVLDTWFATTEGLIRKSGRSHERQLHHPAAARDGEALVSPCFRMVPGIDPGLLIQRFPRLRFRVAAVRPRFRRLAAPCL